MEMRLLTTEREREIFAQRLAEARAKNGASFRDDGPTKVHNQVRLESSNLYALFEADSDPAPQMVAGVALHDLVEFPQSCHEPDLSHLPPRSVLECSDHWSLSRGAGMHSWRGIAVQVVHRNPNAVLVYLAAGSSSDHGGFYSAMGFAKSGEIVEHPYLEGPDDGKLWVQPMILAGDALARLTASVRMQTIDARDDYQVIRFGNSARLRPCSLRRTTATVAARAPDNAIVQAAIGRGANQESTVQLL
jgi:hypothetical protein